MSPHRPTPRIERHKSSVDDEGSPIVVFLWRAGFGYEVSTAPFPGHLRDASPKLRTDSFAQANTAFNAL